MCLVSLLTRKEFISSWGSTGRKLMNKSFQIFVLLPGNSHILKPHVKLSRPRCLIKFSSFKHLEAYRSCIRWDRSVLKSFSSLMTRPCPTLKTLPTTTPLPAASFSSDTNHMSPPLRAKHQTWSDRAFSVAAPDLWNSLPKHIWDCTSMNRWDCIYSC